VLSAERLQVNRQVSMLVRLAMLLRTHLREVCSLICKTPPAARLAIDC
jgi:hypothetical protein